MYLLHSWRGRYGEAFSLYKLDNVCYVSWCRPSRTSILLLEFTSENIDLKVPVKYKRNVCHCDGPIDIFVMHVLTTGQKYLDLTRIDQYLAVVYIC